MERLALCMFVFICACVISCGTYNASVADNLKQLKRLKNKAFLLEMLSILPDRREANVTKCLEDLLYLNTSLASHKLWALKMIDASTKLQSGILEGNVVDLGQYDECIDILQGDVNSTFQGQYCLVDITFLMGGSLLTNSLNLKNILPDSLTIILSLCLPSSCSSNEIKHLYEILVSLALMHTSGTLPSVLTNISVTSDKTDCHIKTTTPLSLLEWFALWIIIILLLLAVLATVYEYINKIHSSTEDTSLKDEVVSCFSLRVNLRRLFSTNLSAETMPVINGLKAFSIAWVVLGHRCRYSADFPVTNLLRMTYYIKEWYSMIVLNGTLSVDVFFVVSGLLNAYSFLYISRGRRKPVSFSALSYVHRYLRLTPAYSLMILLTATWVYRAGDGPVWNLLAGKARNDCTTNWWSNLIYINNYYSPDNNCMMQSWYLAADMQMFWLSPLLLYPLLKWPLFGIVEGGVLCVVSIFVPFYVAYVNNIATPIPLTKDAALVNQQMRALYLPTHTKTISYVIGLLTGYFIHTIRREKTRFKISTVTAGLTWLAAVMCLTGSLFGCYWLYQLDHPYNKWESSLYIGFYRLFWSAGIAWIIFACTTGYGGIVNSFLSLRMFTVLGRLTYCIYLVHVAVIISSIGSLRVPQHFTIYGQICLFFGDFAISVILAAVLNLTLESPLMALEKIVFRRRKCCFSILDKVDVDNVEHRVNWKSLTQAENTKICID